MKTLENYKKEYKNAKTQKGKSSAFNRAMNNLSYIDKQNFYEWQVKLMNN